MGYMALSQKHKEIKKKKCEELEFKISQKQELRQKMVEMQQQDLQKVDDEIEDLTVQLNAMNALK